MPIKFKIRVPKTIKSQAFRIKFTDKDQKLDKILLTPDGFGLGGSDIGERSDTRKGFRRP